MMLYSHRGSYPRPIPFRIVLSDGRKRTDPSTFTEQEIVDAGYIKVESPPVITSTQILSWEGDILSWVVTDKSQEQIRQEYINSVPAVVTMRQTRLALFEQGLLDSVNNVLSTLEGQGGDAARIEWEYANEVYRDSQLVNSLANGLGWTENMVLELFVLADTL